MFIRSIPRQILEAEIAHLKMMIPQIAFSRITDKKLIDVHDLDTSGSSTKSSKSLLNFAIGEMNQNKRMLESSYSSDGNPKCVA